MEYIAILKNEHIVRIGDKPCLHCFNGLMENYFIPVKERKVGKWIPVSERLPNDLEPVNITLVNHEPKAYYHDIKDKPFTATGVYFNGQWYWWSATCTDILAEYSHNYDNIIDNAIEVTAWQPLPKPEEK